MLVTVFLKRFNKSFALRTKSVSHRVEQANVKNPPLIGE